MARWNERIIHIQYPELTQRRRKPCAMLYAMTHSFLRLRNSNFYSIGPEGPWLEACGVNGPSLFGAWGGGISLRATIRIASLTAAMSDGP